jgi:hypothetical protein
MYLDTKLSCMVDTNDVPFTLAPGDNPYYLVSTCRARTVVAL